MTLLQTRVDDQIARRFRQVAKERGTTPYNFLQELVTAAAAKPKPRGWDTHRKLVAQLRLKPLPFGAVERDRETSDER
jgi:hypothetical protein